MQSRRLHLLAIPSAALLAILPLLVRGTTCGHDLSFHLQSWLEAARQISIGTPHPNWAYTPAFSAGEPRFLFYPPLSWTLGALLTLLLQHLPFTRPDQAFAYAPILYTGLALALAGFSMHTLLRRYTTAPAALLLSTLYLTNPYTLFTAYERAAFAELLAAACIPLLLLAILPPLPPDARPPHTSPHINTLSLALATALLWLTNAPAAVMGCYTLAVIALLRLTFLYRETRNLRSLLEPGRKILAGTLLGLTLPAFYLVPAAFEQRWVEIQMATIPSLRISDNTLFHHTGDPDRDAVIHTASLLAVLLLAFTAAALTAARSISPRSSRQSQLVTYLATLAVLIALLLTPVALPLWRHAPELAFLQFPWRLLAILAPVLALALALVLRRVPLTTPFALTASLLLPLLLVAIAYTSFHQGCDPSETPQSQLAAFRSDLGTEPTDEYTPVTADNDALHPGNPPFCLLAPGSDTAEPCPPAAISGPAPTHLDLNLPQPRQLVLNLRNYPAWHVTRNGLPVAERLDRNDGLLAFNLPAGSSHLEITFATTPDRWAGDAISLAALSLLLLPAIRGRRSPKDTAPSLLSP